MAVSSSPSTVSVLRTSPEQLPADVRRAIEHGLRQGLDPQRQTLVKINGNFNLKYPGSNTSCWFLDALLDALRGAGFENLAVIEGDLPEFRAVDMIESTGLAQVLERHGVPFRPIEDLPRDSLGVPRWLEECQLLNVPVFHTHAQAVISCATKNLFGLLPWDRRKYHGELETKLIELYRRVPCFTIVDGTVGLDGESTRRGNPVRCDLIISGADTIAVDWYVAGIMGFRPEEIPLLAVAQGLGLSGARNGIEGDFDRSSLPRYQFELKLSPLRRFTNAINRTPLVRFAPLWNAGDFVRVRLHALNHQVKRRKLEQGPWMAYERRYLDRAT